MALKSKRHLFLTGGRGVGKTTLLEALAAENPGMPGVVTRAIPGREVEMENKRTGERFPIGVFDPAIAGQENRMRPIRENLEINGTALLRACGEGESPWVLVDEIGYLEADCPAYCGALEELMDRKRLLAAVRKQELPFLQGLLRRDDACVVDLDRPFGNLGCVIMASGLGKRFGGNKLMADFCGQPMICRALDATEEIFQKRVVVTRHEDVARLCEERGASVILHDLPDHSDTVRLGIEFLGEEVEGCLFCPGDQPLLRRETAELMALCADGEHIWQLTHGERAGAPVLFPPWCFQELKTLPQGKGGSFLVKKYPDRVRPVPAAEEHELQDADTRQELEELKKLAR